MKISWKGSISFGLVNINVELYSAIAHQALGFKLLHSSCHKPISYHRWCPHCKKEVIWEDVVKGIKLANGSYFIMTPENIKKLKPEKTDIITIIEFVNHDALDPLLLDKHYYVAPSKTPYNAFFLFAQALEDLGMVAIGQVVLRDKQYVCAIRPYKNMLLLTTLNYAYEVKRLPKMEELKKPKLPVKDLKLAESFIKKLSKKKFDITQYKDTFATELLKRIKNFEKGKQPKKRAKKPEKLKETSLIKALQKSINQIKEPTEAIRAR